MMINAAAAETSTFDAHDQIAKVSNSQMKGQRAAAGHIQRKPCAVQTC